MPCDKSIIIATISNPNRGVSQWAIEIVGSPLNDDCSAYFCEICSWRYNQQSKSIIKWLHQNNISMPDKAWEYLIKGFDCNDTITLLVQLGYRPIHNVLRKYKRSTSKLDKTVKDFQQQKRLLKYLIELP